jgi:tripartite-type tricarboxylate transporter receptor subunit TctC
MLMFALVAAGQSYPDRPLRMMVPFPPGGSTENYARIVSRGLAGVGQQIVIDNRSGAGGTLGAEMAARAPADGYTLWIGQDGNLALGPAMRSHTPYDPPRFRTDLPAGHHA